MRRYYIAARILLVLPIIDFAVTAPVLVQQKPQARGYVVHTAVDVETKLGRRGGDLDELWFKVFGHPESHFPSSPEEPPAARPPSSSQSSVPTEESTNVEQPVPSIQNKESEVASPGHAPPTGDDPLNKPSLDLYGHRLSYESLAGPLPLGSPPSGPTHSPMEAEQPVPLNSNEASQVASPVHAAPIAGDDELNKVWLDLYGHRFFDQSFAARPSWSSTLSEPTHGWMGVERHPVPYIPNKPLQVASSGYAPPIPGDDELNKLWLESLDLYGHHSFDESLAASPSWSSALSGPAHGRKGVKQQIPPILNEPSQMASSGSAPPSPGDDELNKLWLDLYGHRFFDESLAAPPSWSSALSGPTHGWMGVKQQVPPIPNEPSQMASSGHAPPSPGDDELNKLWLDLYGHRFFDESLAPPPSWSSALSGPAHGWMGVKQQVPSIPNEPLQVATSPGRESPSLNMLWHSPSEPGSLVTRPSSSSQSSRPAGVPVDVEQPVPPIHEEMWPVSSPDRASPSLSDVWNNLIQGDPEESSASHTLSSS